MKLWPRNTKGGSITVPLTSCLTGLESGAWLQTIIAFICKTDWSKLVFFFLNFYSFLSVLYTKIYCIMKYCSKCCIFILMFLSLVILKSERKVFIIFATIHFVHKPSVCPPVGIWSSLIFIYFVFSWPLILVNFGYTLFFSPLISIVSVYIYDKFMHICGLYLHFVQSTRIAVGKEEQVSFLFQDVLLLFPGRLPLPQRRALPPGTSLQR